MEEDIDTLISGARYGDLGDVRSALKTSVEVNCKDEQGRTGLGRVPSAVWSGVCTRPPS